MPLRALIRAVAAGLVTSHIEKTLGRAERHEMRSKLGEASRRKKAAANVGVLLGDRFAELGIDTSAPGFYDHPAFVAEEEKNPRFLETYAQWVLGRHVSAEESARVRDTLPRIAEIVRARLDRHQWYGACLPITVMVSCILDRLGIWNCAFGGSVSILDHRSGESRHFAIVDEHEGPGYERGHMWLAVPPFQVVDFTLHHQRWRSGDSFSGRVPATILSDTPEIIRLASEDVIAPAVISTFAKSEGRKDPQLHKRLLKDQVRISSMFPPRKLTLDGVELRYVPARVTASDVPLELINIDGRAGVPAIQIWREDIIPAFGLAPDA